MRPRGVKRLFAFSSRTREEVRADVREEFEFHLDMRTAELVRLGMSETDARAQARREFGNATRGAVACVRQGDRIERRRRLGQFVGELRLDATIGLRLLGRSPGFAVVAILTLALGIGANTAIFSALDAALLRPLPYPGADRLVHVFETREDGGENSVAGGAYLDWRQHQTQFVALALLDRVSYNLRGRGTPERLSGIEASHELLQVLGVAPLLGRGFLPEDDRPGGRNDVVILTEELWRSRFGGDPALLNDTIVLDEIPRTVIGILPRGAWLFREDTFFVPAVLQPGTPRAMRAPHWALVLGRIKPEATVAHAVAELKAIKSQLEADYPSFKRPWSVGATALPEMVAGPARPAVLVLAGAVSLVLLIACANVANLLLARACNRRQEIAVRAALGATGGRIVRQALTESLVLAMLGGAAGLAVAYWGVRLLQYLTADFFPAALAPRLDLRVLAFSLLVTAATGLLFGTLPALRSRRPDLNDTLKNGGKSATAGRGRAQSTLIVAEVALTVVLLASAGLLLRSLANAIGADPGFEPARVLAFDLSLPRTTYTADEKRMAFAVDLLSRIRALPGVQGAGTGMAVPFAGGGFGEYFRRPDRTEQRDRKLGRLDYVSPGYLEALGTRLLAGRRFTDADNRAGGPRVAVVSETTARMFYPDKQAVGERLTIAANEWQIVGVIADVVDRRLDVPHGPFAYVPQAFDAGRYSIVVRTSLEPMTLVSSVQREIQRLDPGVALANPRSLGAALTGSMTQRRMVLTLVGAFAAAALMLACIGLYGVMAYSVATRRREICIRMALGAVRRDVVNHVLRDGLRLIAVGLFLGIAGALVAARLLASELYQVRGYDPLVLIGTVAAIVLVAAAACWLPAARAARFDPMAALRNE